MLFQKINYLKSEIKPHIRSHTKKYSAQAIPYFSEYML